jgi:hypothetical protein
LGDRDSKAVPLWKKVYVLIIFVLFVVPFLWVIAYPAVTHTSAYSTLGQALAFLASPVMLVIEAALGIFALVYFLYVRKLIG